jgi:hypothetical protein
VVGSLGVSAAGLEQAANTPQHITAMRSSASTFFMVIPPFFLFSKYPEG